MDLRTQVAAVILQNPWDKPTVWTEHRDSNLCAVRRRKMESDTQGCNVPTPTRPYWIPDGVDFGNLPHDLQVAITSIVAPAYKELVLGAAPGLAQSTGVTIVHSLWLEIQDQFAIAQSGQQPDSEEDASKDRATQVGRLLRTIKAKDNASKFWVRLHEFRERYGTLPGSFDPIRRQFADEE
ncbi:MAG: hypothetical protein ACI92S_003424 [Planctomycetaceae bacterium]